MTSVNLINSRSPLSNPYPRYHPQVLAGDDLNLAAVLEVGVGSCLLCQVDLMVAFQVAGEEVALPWVGPLAYPCLAA